MKKSIQQLFVDFIVNRASVQEIETVRQLIEKGENEKEWRQAMEEAETLLMERSSPRPGNQPKPLSFLRQQKWWMAAAASILLVGFVAFFLRDQQQQAQVVSDPIVKSPRPKAHQWLKLPDGTSVQLNSNSHLDYPDSFAGKAKREVTLVGEAYFDVSHDSDHPFVIHTGKIRTTVLGTAFNISAYDAGSAVTVTVIRGKVKVDRGEHTLAVLMPNEQLAWNARPAPPVKARVNGAEVVAWKSLDLIMDDITLEEASALIEQRFGITVRFANDRVRACRFTAAFLDRNDITQVMRVISEITGAQFSLKNKTVTIDGPGC